MTKNPSLLHYIPDATRDDVPEWIREWLARVRPGQVTKAPKVGAIPAKLSKRRAMIEYLELHEAGTPTEEAVSIICRRHEKSRSTVYTWIRGAPRRP